MTPILRHLRHNAIAYVALFVALGGTSYAAFTLPAGSVGARQIKNHSIDPVKLNPKFITGSVRAWAIVGADGRVVAGGGGPRASGDAPYPGTYVITWGSSLRKGCGAIATIDSGHSPITERVSVPGNPSVPFTAGYAVVFNTTTGAGRRNSGTSVQTFNQAGQLTPLGFDVTVVC